MLSEGYKNDLDPWRERKDPNNSDQPLEDGLYTGETALHIAIVKENQSLVKQLLDMGIDLDSRATGVFFQPRWIRRRRGDQTWVHRMTCFVWAQPESADAFAVVPRVENEESGCYYGEYPLSFAASLGNRDICQLIYDAAKARFETAVKAEIKAEQAEGGDGMKRACKEEASCSHTVRPPSKQCSSASKSKSAESRVRRGFSSSVAEEDAIKKRVTKFVNARDTFGNTALHMAVLHNRKECVDWIMSTDEGKESLDIYNLDGLSPLTLAAREGNVEMFEYLLHNHMSEDVWTYGKVRMRKTDLTQVETTRPHLSNGDQRPGKIRSALEVIVAFEKKEFLDSELFVNLIRGKWKKFGRRHYLIFTLIPYLVLLAAFCALVVLRGDEFQEGFLQQSPTNPTQRICVQRSEDVGQWIRSTMAHDGPSLILQAFLFFVGTPFLVYQGWKQRWSRLGCLGRSEDRTIWKKEVGIHGCFGAIGAWWKSRIRL